MNETCHFFLVPSRSSSTSLYPSIVLRAKERALIPCPFVVFNLGLPFESFKELGAHHQGRQKDCVLSIDIAKFHFNMG
jgi:hypothetical protein